MDLNVMVIDNFLDDPDSIRKYALQCNFDIRGRFPGVRAKWENSKYSEELDYKLNEIIGAPVTHQGSSTEFQICTEYEDDNWIHHDTKMLAGVLYLTPNAPLEYGTSLFRHKETGAMSHSDYVEENGLHRKAEQWEETVNVGNVYNRLILYNGFLYHRSNNIGFGNKLENSRLTQVFFMDLETE